MNTGPVILIVDDSPTLCKIVSLSLEKAGYRVLVARDGIQALAQLSRAIPDLVVLDIEMPSLDGYKVCEVIRRSERGRSLPVLMLSGREGAVDMWRSRLAGASDYLTKPVAASVLLQAIEAWLPT